MSEFQIHLQEHGYRNGHQLLATSLKLPREDQDTVDRLSDMSGPLSPGETFDPYITAYPLPSRAHYVVARTWQDLEAPRAGCVLTKSIVVPMPLWKSLKNLNGLLAYLTPLEPGCVCESVVFNQSNLPQPIVHDSRVVELFESMFLEDRKPIVFFEAPEAEAITARFLAALWSSLKTRFAVCTHAIAPRKIEGRYFDLVFSPKSARARFSGNDFRRIGTGSPNLPRHRWSEAKASQIFRSDPANLVEIDAVEFLANDKQGDASKLRMALLWEELKDKATNDNSSPTAVLAMLDLINSQAEPPMNLLESILPVISQAVKTANDTLSEPNALHFLITLLGKFPRRQATPHRILDDVEVSAAKLAKRNPEAAIEFLLTFSRDDQLPPIALLTGLGNGLGSSNNFCSLIGTLTNLQPNIGLSLLTLSTGFTCKSIEMAKTESIEWNLWLCRLFQEPDSDIKSEAREFIIPMMNDAVLAPLLSHVVHGVTTDELVEIATQIGFCTSFSIEEYDEPLRNATSCVSSIESLRNAIANKFENQGADRFLVGMLSLDSADIAWLCSGAIKKKRALSLLLQVLENFSNDDIEDAQCDRDASEQILELLLSDETKSVAQISRILVYGDIDIEKFLKVGLQILPELSAEPKVEFGKFLLERVLKDADPKVECLPAIMRKFGPVIDPSELVQMATIKTASSSRIGANIVVLEATSEDLRKRIIHRIDEISGRLVERTKDDLGEDAYTAWAKMINDSGTLNRNAQIHAANFVLPYALHLIDYPVSTLIMVTFPIMYRECLEKDRDKGNEQKYQWNFPMLFLYPNWGQTEKSHQKLLRKLVNAFISSSWPPADLMLIAIDAGIEEKVIKQLRRNIKGNQYVAQIYSDSRRLGKSKRKNIKKLLSKF